MHPGGGLVTSGRLASVDRSKKLPFLVGSPRAMPRDASASTGRVRRAAQFDLVDNRPTWRTEGEHLTGAPPDEFSQLIGGEDV